MEERERKERVPFQVLSRSRFFPFLSTHISNVSPNTNNVDGNVGKSAHSTCCGGFPGTPQDLLRLNGTDTRRPLQGRPEFRINDYKLQSAPHYNHIYKHIIMRTIKPQM